MKAAHSTPEAYRVNCLGILREEEWDTVPGFRELAAASGGRAVFHVAAEEDLGLWMLENWWLLIMGSPKPAWGSCPL